MKNSTNLINSDDRSLNSLIDLIKSIESLKNFVIMQMDLCASGEVEALKGEESVAQKRVAITSGAQALRVIINREKQIRFC